MYRIHENRLTGTWLVYQLVPNPRYDFIHDADEQLDVVIRIFSNRLTAQRYVDALLALNKQF